MRLVAVQVDRDASDGEMGYNQGVNHQLPAGGNVHNAPLASTYFNMRKTTIYGGSNEVQRNIVAQTVLGS